MTLELKDIDFSVDWNYTQPTLHTNRIQRENRAQDEETFATRFNNLYGPYLSRVSFENIVVAGGSVMGCLVDEKWGNDIDIFFYGLSAKGSFGPEEKVKELLTSLYDSYYEHLIQKKEELSEAQLEALLQDSIETIRNNNCITLLVDGQKIQIILRLYKSIKELLDNFDLGSSSVAYDGKNVHFSARGKWSYENLANKIEPKKRSTTYEYRLQKYWHRGFKIVLSELDMRKLSTDNFLYGMPEIAKLPYLPFAYNQIKGNKITLKQFLSVKTCVKSDYSEDDFSFYKLIYLNLRTLMKGDDNYYYYSKGANFNILHDTPYFDLGLADDFYDILERKIKERTVPVKSLVLYFSEEIAQNILVEMLEQTCPDVNQLMQEQKRHVSERFILSGKKGLVWKVNNPGSQINGSYNPIISDAKDWYGIYKK